MQARSFTCLSSRSGTLAAGPPSTPVHNLTNAIGLSQEVPDLVGLFHTHSMHMDSSQLTALVCQLQHLVGASCSQNRGARQLLRSVSGELKNRKVRPSEAIRLLLAQHALRYTPDPVLLSQLMELLCGLSSRQQSKLSPGALSRLLQMLSRQDTALVKTHWVEALVHYMQGPEVLHRASPVDLAVAVWALAKLDKKNISGLDQLAAAYFDSIIAPPCWCTHRLLKGMFQLGMLTPEVLKRAEKLVWMYEGVHAGEILLWYGLRGVYDANMFSHLLAKVAAVTDSGSYGNLVCAVSACARVGHVQDDDKLAVIVAAACRLVPRVSTRQSLKLAVALSELEQKGWLRAQEFQPSQQLTLRVKQSNNWEELAELYEQHKGLMNSIHIAECLSKLAYCLTQKSVRESWLSVKLEKKGAQTCLPGQQLYNNMALHGEGTSKVGGTGNVGGGDVASNSSSSGLLHPTLVFGRTALSKGWGGPADIPRLGHMQQGLVEVLKVRWKGSSCQSTASILHSWVRLRYCPPSPLFDQLCTALRLHPRKLQVARPQCLVRLLESHLDLSHMFPVLARDQSLIRKVLSACLWKVRDFSYKELGMLAATLGKLAQTMAMRGEPAAGQHSRMNGQEQCDGLRGATLELVEVSCSLAVDQLYDADAITISALLHASATVGFTSQEHHPVLLNRYLELVSRGKLHHACRVMWAAGRMVRRGLQVRDQIVRLSASVALATVRLNGQDVCNVFWALAQVRVCPQGIVMRLLRRTLPMMEDLSPQETSVVLWGLGRLKCLDPAGLVQLLDRAVYFLDQDQLTLQHIAMISWSLAHLNFKHDGWFDRLPGPFLGQTPVNYDQMRSYIVVARSMVGLSYDRHHWLELVCAWARGYREVLTSRDLEHLEEVKIFLWNLGGTTNSMTREKLTHEHHLLETP